MVSTWHLPAPHATPALGHLHPPGFLAFRRVWQRDAVSEMTRRKNEGFFRTCWLNGSWSTQAWNLRKVRFLRKVLWWQHVHEQMCMSIGAGVHMASSLGPCQTTCMCVHEPAI